MVVGFIFLATSVPFIKQIIQHPNDYFARSKNVSIFNLKTPYYGISPSDIKSILIHQINYSLKGFVLFNTSVAGEGIENSRYLPPKTPPINYFIVILYYLGIIVALISRRGYVFLGIIVMNILFLQIPSVLIPNWSRGLISLPAMYYFAGYGLACLWKIVNLTAKPIIVVGLKIATIAIIAYTALSDVHIYYKWVNSRQFTAAQQPAILVGDIPLYQKAQVDRISNGMWPFSFYQWEEMKIKQSETVRQLSL